MRFNSADDPDTSHGPKSDKRGTPRWLLRTFFVALGGLFDTDPAAMRGQKPIATTEYTPDDDGLSPDNAWNRAVWLNPPYSNIRPWLARAHEETTAGDAEFVLALIHANVATDYFHEQATKAEAVYALRTRLCFENAPESDAKRPSVIVVYGDVPRGVRDALDTVGVRLEPNPQSQQVSLTASTAPTTPRASITVANGLRAPSHTLIHQFGKSDVLVVDVDGQRFGSPDLPTEDGRMELVHLTERLLVGADTDNRCDLVDVGPPWTDIEQPVDVADHERVLVEIAAQDRQSGAFVDISWPVSDPDAIEMAWVRDRQPPVALTPNHIELQRE